MHDAMTDGGRLNILLVAQPGTCRVQGRRHIGNGCRLVFALDEDRAIRPACPQSRVCADAVHLAFDPALQLPGSFNRKDLELDA